MQTGSFVYLTVHASTLASTAEDLTSETEEPASATPASGEDDIDPLFGGQLPRLPKLHRDPLEEYAELSASEVWNLNYDILHRFF